MDYKEKVIALLNDQELSKEQKEKLENIFPELKEKETEDERIRKAIIAYINHGQHNGVSNKDMIAWLEKQDEQKPYGQRKECEDCQSNYAGECKGFCQMERDEQKPIDKVESKFHEGEWIIHQGTENIYQVIARIDNQYQLKYGDNYTVQKCADVDRCARLWNITKDAKDGDVLYLQHEGVEHIIIYKRLFKKNFHTILSVRCAYDGSTNDFFEDVDYYHCITSERDEKEIHPATKEQRDLLFSKMKEAGYEWDAEKKELKKMEVVSKESEDERIREQLCDFLRDNMLYQDAQYFISWLEDKKKYPNLI